MDKKEWLFDDEEDKTESNEGSEDTQEATPGHPEKPVGK